MAVNLSATVVIDYQNLHLTGHGQFPSTSVLPKHDTLIDPLLYALGLLRERNAKQCPGYPHAVLRQVLVYRGLPIAEYDPKDNRRSQAQKAHWERDQRVTVTLRALKYTPLRDATGQITKDAAGNRISVRKREKGIDVLCALAVVREAQDPCTDLVILASTDSDLAPALDEVQLLGTAKIETANWWASNTHCQQLRPTNPRKRVWNTRLTETEFRACWDQAIYP